MEVRVEDGLSDNGPYAGPEDHSKFWYLIVIGIELTVLASLFIVTRYTVQHRSGLNEPDKIRRIWARAPEIRFQPVVRPLLFAAGVSYGSQTVIHAFMTAFLSLFGLYRSHGSFIALAVGFISLGVSSLLSIVIYRATGGTNWKLCAAGTLLFDWFMSGVLLNAAMNLYSIAGDGFKSFLVFALASGLFLAVLQTPFFIWGAYRRMPATARLIYNSSVVPNWVKLDRTILVSSGPLMAIFFIAYLCEFTLKCDSYLSNLTAAFATSMLLAAASLTSILSVNRALLANEFQWQWRAFLTPAIPMGVMKFLTVFLRLITGRESYLYSIWTVAHFFLSCGGCGALGAYCYLSLAEKYAQAHIDDDMLAQDDLLADFEEDEDNEELDI